MKHIPPSPDAKRLTLRLPQDLWRRLSSEAAKQDMTATLLINRWIEEKLSPTGAASSLREVTSEEQASQAGAAVRTPKSDRPIWEEIAEIMSLVPEEDLATLPTDLAEQHDHYLYGTPKR
jgi:predicted DNA-binding ribbon-helix-helix protein